MPLTSPHAILENGDLVCSLRYMRGACDGCLAERRRGGERAPCTRHVAVVEHAPHALRREQAHYSRCACVLPSARLMCPALQLTSDIPDEQQLLRWLGEPVRVVYVPTRYLQLLRFATLKHHSVFLTNAKGFPVLSRAHQAFLKALFKATAPPPMRFGSRPAAQGAGGRRGRHWRQGNLCIHAVGVQSALRRS